MNSTSANRVLFIRQTWFAYGAFSNPAGFDNGGANIRTVRAQVITADGNGVVQPVTPITVRPISALMHSK